MLGAEDFPHLLCSCGKDIAKPDKKNYVIADKETTAALRRLSKDEREELLSDAYGRRRIMPTTRRSTKQPAAAANETPVKRRTSHGLQKAVQPSAELAAIVGNTPLPRTEITKRLWAYIKEHGLQDAKNKRLINADAKLRPVVGEQAQVSMFDLSKLVSRHVQ